MIFGPDVASMFLSNVLIAGPALAFCIKMFLKGKDNSKWYPVAAIGLFLTILVSFVSASKHMYDSFSCVEVVKGKRILDLA